MQVFETIVDTTTKQNPYSTFEKNYATGYENYHKKTNYITVTNTTGNTFITFGVLKTNNEYTYTSSAAIAYSLRHKGALDCPKIKSVEKDVLYKNFFYEEQFYSKPQSDDYQKYIEFVEKNLIAQIKSDFSSVRLCKMDDKFVGFVDPALSEADTVQMLCKGVGGTLQSMREVIETICQKFGPSKVLASNFEILSVTCSNYESYINFDADGEILYTKIIELAGQDNEIDDYSTIKTEL